MNAKSSVWRVSNGQTELFLGGTVHLLGKKDFPLPCEFDTAFRRAEKLILEADLRQARSPEFARRYASRTMYPTGDSLTHRLSHKTRKSLQRLLRRIGLPRQPYLQMKPGVLMSSLVSHELRKRGVTPGGLDDHYLNRAMGKNLQLGFLESTDSQMNLIINIANGNEDSYVQHLIETIPKLTKMFEKTVRAWRAGDLGALADAAAEQTMRQLYPVIFDQLLTQRNNQWLGQIGQMLETHEIEFVLVGALHMATDVGLINQLRQRGYQVDSVVGCS